MKHVAVLDLGTSRIVCAVVAANPDGDTKLLARAEVPCKGLRRGVVTDLDETAHAVDEAVREVQRGLGEELPDLVVNVAGSHLEGLTGQGYKPVVPRGRHVTYQDVMEVVSHSRSLVLPPDREQIQAVPREFRVDGLRDVKRPIGMGGGTLEAITFIVTGSVVAVQNIERAVNMAGRRVDQKVASPLAAGLGLLSQDEIDHGVAVVDIGAGTTDIGIFCDGSIVSAISLPISAGTVTSDISKLLNTSPEEAERLKLAYAVAYAKGIPEKETIEVVQLGSHEPRPLQRKLLCEIVESRTRETATMIGQYIEKSGLAGMLPGGMVLTGGGVRLRDLDRVFEEEMPQMKIRVAPTVETGSAVSLGLARFVLHCHEDLVPASAPEGVKGGIRTLFSIFQK